MQIGPSEQHSCKNLFCLCCDFFKFMILVKCKLGYSWGRRTPRILVLPILETSNHAEFNGVCLFARHFFLPRFCHWHVVMSSFKFLESQPLTDTNNQLIIDIKYGQKLKLNSSFWEGKDVKTCFQVDLSSLKKEIGLWCVHASLFFWVEKLRFETCNYSARARLSCW